MTLRTLLPVATYGTGIVAGLFVAFSVAVMPALHGASDRTFVDVMQRMNVSIVNPVFLLLFLGSPILLVVAAVTDRRAPVLVAAGLTVVALLITFTINIPLNEKLAAASLDDAASAREAFERLWNLAHLARTLLMAASFASCLVALRAT